MYMYSSKMLICNFSINKIYTIIVSRSFQIWIVVKTPKFTRILTRHIFTLNYFFEYFFSNNNNNEKFYTGKLQEDSYKYIQTFTEKFFHESAKINLLNHLFNINIHFKIWFILNIYFIIALFQSPVISHFFCF